MYNIYRALRMRYGRSWRFCNFKLSGRLRIRKLKGDILSREALFRPNKDFVSFDFHRKSFRNFISCRGPGRFAEAESYISRDLWLTFRDSFFDVLPEKWLSSDNGNNFYFFHLRFRDFFFHCTSRFPIPSSFSVWFSYPI